MGIQELEQGLKNKNINVTIEQKNGEIEIRFSALSNECQEDIKDFMQRHGFQYLGRNTRRIPGEGRFTGEIYFD